MRRFTIIIGTLMFPFRAQYPGKAMVPGVVVLFSVIVQYRFGLIFAIYRMGKS
jgi:hypothetical protein